MAYTPKLIRKQVDTNANRVTYFVEFTDGQQTFTTPFTVALYTPADQVKKLIKERAAEYEAADAILPELADNMVIDLATVDTSIPTEHQEFREWFQKYNRLLRVRELIAAGVLTGNETQVTNLLNQVRQDFKPAFINKF